jgi:2-keto-3-deoxy-L-rhamnonate aldolase RhmA
VAPRADRPGLARRIHGGDALAGLMVKMPAAAVVEMSAYAGFDFVVVDTEHGASDPTLLEAHLRAADAAGIPALVRVPLTSRHLILFALDAGATGLVVPRTEDAATVEAVVEAACYPPIGGRGLALSTRAGRHGLSDVTSHVARALEETVLMMQIEDESAVPNAAAIASHPRVDAVFIGVNDLSSSMGHPGELDHPHVRAAVDEIVAAVLAQDETGLCMLAGTAAEALEWRARGAALTIFTSEILIARQLRDLAGALRDPAIGPATAAPVDPSPADAQLRS